LSGILFLTLASARRQYFAGRVSAGRASISDEPLHFLERLNPGNLLHRSLAAWTADRVLLCGVRHNKPQLSAPTLKLVNARTFPLTRLDFSLPCRSGPTWAVSASIPRPSRALATGHHLGPGRPPPAPASNQAVLEIRTEAAASHIRAERNASAMYKFDQVNQVIMLFLHQCDARHRLPITQISQQSLRSAAISTNADSLSVDELNAEIATRVRCARSNSVPGTSVCLLSDNGTPRNSRLTQASMFN
jgi:hypothetical protein